MLRPLMLILVPMFALAWSGSGASSRCPEGGASAVNAFTEAETCALCHSGNARATAMLSPTGEDASMHGLWQATMMAQSFRDPYWRAQVSKEMAQSPEHADEIQGLCITCHAPMHHHNAKLNGQVAQSIKAAESDPLAKDGVSCTVCHQIQEEGLGTESSFSGQPLIKDDKRIFGPYENPVQGPMRMHTGYTPTQGKWIRKSAVCGSCHTLYTGEGETRYLEQAPYIEWRNSRFSTESVTPNSEPADCQDCHMPELGTQRIARSPMGADFLIDPRDGVRAHAFVGGNAFMLDLLAKHREVLGVPAAAKDLAKGARRTRALLRTQTARVAIHDAALKDGQLAFDVSIENLCGHKFPSAYPSRRAWLEVQVRAGRRMLFHSGGTDQNGKIEGISDPRNIPHRNVVSDANQVPVYEVVPGDAEGKPTTSLHRMVKNLKDNRLLPKGWSKSGPHAEETAPVGIGEDPDFTAGSDRVHYRIPIDAPDGSRLRVLVWLRYQTIPPHWVKDLRSTETPEAERFIKMYDGMRKVPETIDVRSAFVR